MKDFQEWLELVQFEPGADFEVAHLNQPSKAILLDIHKEYGWIDGRELRTHLLPLREKAAAWALALVADDLPKINIEGPGAGVTVGESGYADGFQGVFANGHEISSIDRIDVLLEVAENHQTDVMEHLHRAVPSCPEHPVALTPKRMDDTATWWCQAGGHAVAEIGDLTPPGSARWPRWSGT